MTPDKIRIRLAEAEGWTHTRVGWVHPDGRQKISAPTYDSLDDIARVEAKLPPNLRGDYIEWLGDIVERNPDAEIQWSAITATATQRAEAILRALGKWEDS